jgi:hypothetical protein
LSGYSSGEVRENLDDEEDSPAALRVLCRGGPFDIIIYVVEGLGRLSITTRKREIGAGGGVGSAKII